MGNSTLAIDTGEITDFEDGTVNQTTTLDSTFNEIVTKFNASLETSTGHYHDGTDSRLAYGGTSGWNAEEMLLGLLTGAFGNRGGL